MEKIKHTLTDFETQTATHLSLVEIGLGSLLHSFKIPFSGHFLSLNQGFFLSYNNRVLRAYQDSGLSRFKIAQTHFEVSFIAATFKSLSPAGQKLGPMLSIATQGFLYSLGILVGGTQILGMILGMVLLSLWAFIQPFITLLISFGSDLTQIIDFYIQRLEKDYAITQASLWQIILIIASLKILLGISLAVMANSMKSKTILNWQERLSQFHKPSDSSGQPSSDAPSIHRLVLKDLTRPLFLFSIILSLFFLFMTETDHVVIFWKMLRPIAIATLLFYLIRSPLTVRFVFKIANKSKYLRNMIEKAQRTLNQLK